MLYTHVQAFVTHGMEFWGLDVEVHYVEKGQRLKFANIKVIESGPLFAAVETEVKYNKSTIKLTVSASPDVISFADVIHQISLNAFEGVPDCRLSPDLQLNGSLAPHPYPFNQFVFSAEVDWHERHELLKCT